MPWPGVMEGRHIHRPFTMRRPYAKITYWRKNASSA